METKYGFPIVTADNVFEILKEKGIAIWPQVQLPMSFEEYRVGNLIEEQKEEMRRYVPRIEVVFLQDPTGKIYNKENPFRGFRTVIKNSTTTFVLLEDDFIPITAEFKHGGEDIVLVPPSGVPRRDEPMDVCAKREFMEETGIELKEVIPLSERGVVSITRYCTHRYFPFLGIPKIPISLRPIRHGKGELLQVILVPLKDWLELIRKGKVTDLHARDITFVALQRLGRLKV